MACSDADAIHASLLTPEGMRRARIALATMFPWYTHKTTLTFFLKIKDEGLLPQRPRESIAPPPQSVISALGDAANKILCFWPVGSAPMNVSHSEPSCYLAISAQDLPERVGLDWSFGGVWNLVNIINEDTPGLELEKIFVDIVRRRGSVASYDRVPVEALRVRTKSACAGDPSSWPLLTETPSEMVFLEPASISDR